MQLELAINETRVHLMQLQFVVTLDIEFSNIFLYILEH